MSWSLNNITAPDTYSAAATLENLPFPPRINLDVANQAIFWQLKEAASPGGLSTEGTWKDEVFMSPGSRTISRPGIRGLRIRAATPAARIPAGSMQAQVTVEAVVG